MPDKSAARSFFRRLSRFLRVAALLLVLALALLFVPAVFQFAVRQGIAFETWRRGGEVRIARVQGSLFEPVALFHSQWSHRSAGGAVSRVEVARAEAEFSWRELLPGRSGHWFRRLTAEGVTGKILVPVSPEVRRAGKPSWAAGQFPFGWFATPARVEAKGVDLIFQSGADYVRLQESRSMLSEFEPGFIEIGQLVVKQPWLTRTFRNVHGATALQSGRVAVADVQLDAGVLVKSFSAEVAEMARGRLDLELVVAAFGGSIRAQAQTSPPDEAPEFEASGAFSQIALAPLATFLGISDAAGGIIKEGKFTFRGLPRDPARATATLRVEATNFQWESRQWDSLVLGATLLDGRVQIPELELRQGHNSLSLNGETALPIGRAQSPRTWWQSDFNLNLVARIDNLTELSALLLPDFQFAAGKMSIDGSIRAKDQQFSGNLIVAGTGLAWRSTPIQELHGAIRLAGKEIQIASLDMLNKDDYLHGQGVVSLGAAGEYRGEMRASVEDLAAYASIAENPLVAQPLAGGAVLRWTGQGSGKGHSGRFFARLQKLRPLRAGGAMPHPVDAELEGSYEPGKTQFSRFNLADAECALTAQVQLSGDALQFSGLRLTHGAQTWLEGDALLPISFWRDWPGAAPAASAPALPVKLNLKATGLSLKHAVRLSGWNWPVEGFVDGALTAHGVLGKLNLGGKATLQSGRLPIGWNGDFLSAANGEFTAAGQVISVANARAEHLTGAYSGAAQIDLANYWDPIVSADAKCDRASFPAFPRLSLPALDEGGIPHDAALQCEAALRLHASGPLSAALLEGEVRLLRFSTGGVPVISFLWNHESALASLPPPFVAIVAPFNRWRLKLALEQPEPAPVVPGAGTILPKLRITGTAAAPALAGAVSLAEVSAQAGPLPLTVKELTLTFSEAKSSDPLIDLRATGVYRAFPFNAYILGPLSHHMSFADSPEALAEFTDVWAAPVKPSATPLQLPERPEVIRDAKVFHWERIFADPAPAPAPPAPTPEPPAPDLARTKPAE